MDGFQDTQAGGAQVVRWCALLTTMAPDFTEIKSFILNIAEKQHETLRGVFPPWNLLLGKSFAFQKKLE
jgi:hypothetical protein